MSWDKQVVSIIGRDVLDVIVSPAEGTYPSFVTIELEPTSLLMADDARAFGLALLAAAGVADDYDEAAAAAVRAESQRIRRSRRPVPGARFRHRASTNIYEVVDRRATEGGVAARAVDLETDEPTGKLVELRLSGIGTALIPIEEDSR